MIDLYHRQHSDRRLAASMPWWADMAGRNQAEGRNLFGLGPTRRSAICGPVWP